MCNTLCSPRETGGEAFAERMLEIYNSGALALMISIGHRTGLFDTMSGLEWATSDEIAHAANLNERYVREWLGAMTTGGIVEHSGKGGTYRLPLEHAAFLTREASPNNLAVPTQFISVLGGVEDRIVECFREGGGVEYEAYARFHEVMAEESDQTVIAALFEHILPLVEGIEARLDAGIDVLDAGCGRGRALMALAARYPASRFVGWDLSKEAISYAKSEASRRGLDNVTFEVRDLTGFSEPPRFDMVTTFDAVHDQADPAGLLSGIRGALRPGGVYLMQDIGGSSEVAGNMENPMAPFVYTISCMHCMTVSLAQGGVGLGAAWGEQLAQKMLREAGFEDIGVQRLEHDIMNVYYVART